MPSIERTLSFETAAVDRVGLDKAIYNYLVEFTTTEPDLLAVEVQPAAYVHGKPMHGFRAKVTATWFEVAAEDES